jgi:hypothetical protein
MKRLVWLSLLLAVGGCGGDTKPTTTPDPAAETKPTGPPPKGQQAALPQ